MILQSLRTTEVLPDYLEKALKDFKHHYLNNSRDANKLMDHKLICYFHDDHTLYLLSILNTSFKDTSSKDLIELYPRYKPGGRSILDSSFDIIRSFGKISHLTSKDDIVLLNDILTDWRASL